MSHPALPRSLKAALITASLSGAGIGVLTETYTAYWEGDVHHVYQDVAGIPTVCYGHTGPDVHPGDRYTEKQCRILLRKDLAAAREVIRRNVTVPLTPGQWVALASFVYNVGEKNFERSTLLRRLNAGDTAGACAEFRRWVYVGHRVLPWQVTRREAGEWLCLNGLPAAPNATGAAE
ncbi:lysozyme [Salmonella enterica subsp. enterica]|nr:lysozyme [Salmonella enterica]EBR9917560.1 lysozyme [Salmonella enterica subsp. enterica serovar Richmond]ECA9679774.1 lysozyme [Salmonella enterica subsp. enterica serovar Mikawasima]ECF2556435.1 lysozyme [Salmonella enterica subsp. enterica serovar Ahuza]ECH0881718.1 lysozyme [Salmonella enterica subsp. enterica serovar Potsdam]EDE8443998.1 glycoside hydrolase family protein [Salmonella enterica subsp. enterica serovar Pomona]EDN8394541.1 lysozyme [Salmonella enterica subsp. enterica ser